MTSTPFDPLPLLSRDPLRHITPLKMYGLYRQAMRAVPVLPAGASRTVQAVVLVSPRSVSQYDQAHYADVQWVVFPALPAQAGSGLVAACVDAILAATDGASFVVKTIDAAVVDALRERLGGERAPQYRRALCTFGWVDSSAEQSAAAEACRLLMVRQAHHERKQTDDGGTIRASDHVPPEALPLLSAHGVYSNTELATLFAAGDARCHLRFAATSPTADAADAAVGVLLTFPNTAAIHEVGSLHVLPAARRTGHARALLASALADLRRRQLTVRYVVDANNASSVALAAAVGLVERFRLAHWVVPAN